VPAFVGVLRRIVQQVADDLDKPGLIAFQSHRPRRKRNGQMMPARLDQRAARLDRAVDDSREVERLARECDLTLRDARDVEQIVHQPRQVLRLALNDIARPLLIGVR
jgi:hypothetical protein